ncbi:pre-rRNA-processing protein ESF2 [Iris pallida]|uniref:Pre-rRNA-processing protein ESF2 n=1 Tax=Iris pallida TaxID=29817 RepID=A0AAX6HBH8_IRIPA|nr:pre-rRNA-processing protein ESF2 [Iris pallida]
MAEPKEQDGLFDDDKNNDVDVSPERDGGPTRAGKKKKRSTNDSAAAAVAGKRGVCYLSRVPPRMDPFNLRQILSRYGEVQRIFLTPEDPTVQVRRKQAGGFRGKEFSEGWVEFTKKSVAKRVANMLNGEQMGGKKRSSFFYDIWNIKYLSNFKWNDLTIETANKNRTREEKLALELSAAKRERDFYLSKVDQSRAIKSMQERAKKKQKTQGPAFSESIGDVQEPKVIRKFPQNRTVDEHAVQSKPRLSKEFLAGVRCPLSSIGIWRFMKSMINSLRSISCTFFLLSVIVEVVVLYFYN